MSGGADTHTVYIEPGNIRPGWCDSCLKPSMVSADVVVMDDDGLSVIADASECRDCGPGSTPPARE